MIIERTIQKSIVERISESGHPRKVIIIYGARQVGKTTLVKEIFAGSNLKKEYFNCDYLDVQSAFSYENAGNLGNIVKNLQLIILDEAQRINNIGMVLKILHDEFPELKIIATGSSSFELSEKISEPLTGRKLVYQLYPFSFRELEAVYSKMDAQRLISKIMRFGTYPSVILEDDRHAAENLNEIASSYLFKDIFTYQSLKKPEILLDLLKLLAFQVSGEVSYTELARKLKVDQTVIQRYIQLLEDSFILFRLQALRKNLRTEVGKTRKVYFWDIGIRNILIQNTNTLDFRDDHGKLWENFCVSERMKYINSSPSGQIRSFFWRTYNQKEIDYIEEIRGNFSAFEFKWSPKIAGKLPVDFSQAYSCTEIRNVNPGNFSEVLYDI
ncbi:MAG: ATP-binding protein [Bacteroidales bacterium]|nr:ATP-binding protein [Bacteroidales bacterium]